MEYAMNRPWWLCMTRPDASGRPRHERHAGHGGGPFGAGFPFGSFPGGPFPGGPFPGGPFGGGPGGRGGRGGRARRGDVRAAILALLLEGPSNGYQVIQALEERTRGVWKPSPGAVYPALSQLEDEGLIEAFDRGGQKAFRLTPSGQEAAAAVDPKPWDVVNDASGANTEGAGDLWREIGSLAMAVKAVVASGSVEQVQAASAAIADARKRLYGLLAEDPGSEDPAGPAD